MYCIDAFPFPILFLGFPVLVIQIPVKQENPSSHSTPFRTLNLTIIPTQDISSPVAWSGGFGRGMLGDIVTRVQESKLQESKGPVHLLHVPLPNNISEARDNYANI